MNPQPSNDKVQPFGAPSNPANVASSKEERKKDFEAAWTNVDVLLGELRPGMYRQNAIAAGLLVYGFLGKGSAYIGGERGSLGEIKRNLNQALDNPKDIVSALSQEIEALLSFGVIVVKKNHDCDRYSIANNPEMVASEAGEQIIRLLTQLNSKWVSRGPLPGTQQAPKQSTEKSTEEKTTQADQNRIRSSADFSTIDAEVYQTRQVIRALSEAKENCKSFLASLKSIIDDAPEIDHQMEVICAFHTPESEAGKEITREIRSFAKRKLSEKGLDSAGAAYKFRSYWRAVRLKGGMVQGAERRFSPARNHSKSMRTRLVKEWAEENVYKKEEQLDRRVKDLVKSARGLFDTAGKMRNLGVIASFQETEVKEAIDDFLRNLNVTSIKDKYSRDSGLSEDVYQAIDRLISGEKVVWSGTKDMIERFTLSIRIAEGLFKNTVQPGLAGEIKASEDPKALHEELFCTFKNQALELSKLIEDLMKKRVDLEEIVKVMELWQQEKDVSKCDEILRSLPTEITGIKDSLPVRVSAEIYEKQFIYHLKKNLAELYFQIPWMMSGLNYLIHQPDDRLGILARIPEDLLTAFNQGYDYFNNYLNVNSPSSSGPMSFFKEMQALLFEDIHGIRSNLLQAVSRL